MLYYFLIAVYLLVGILAAVSAWQNSEVDHKVLTYLAIIFLWLPFLPFVTVIGRKSPRNKRK